MERIRIRTNIDGSGSGFREVQNHTDPNPQHYRLVNRYDTCRGTEIDFFKKHHELANERKAFHFNSICSVLFLWCLLLSLVLLSSSSCEFIVSFFCGLLLTGITHFQAGGDIVCPLDGAGRFTAPVTDFLGKFTWSRITLNSEKPNVLIRNHTWPLYIALLISHW
jgi:hypothetical protein